MAITETDIKLFASQRLTDEADGGGRMTATVVQDGVENNLFPDISTLNRAQGAFHIRKAFLGVVTDTTDTLLGAHVILEDLPDDPDVFATVFRASGAADQREDIVSALNANGVGWDYFGTKPLIADVAIGDRNVPVASTEERFIPLSSDSEVAGGVIGATAGTQQQAAVGYMPVGSAVALVASIVASETAGYKDFSVALDPANYPTSAGNAGNGVHLLPGTIVGTYNGGNGSGTLREDAQHGQLDLLRSGIVRGGGVVIAYANGGTYSYPGTAPSAELTSIAATGQPALSLSRVLQAQRVIVTSANRDLVWSFDLPPGTLAGTESVRWKAGGVTRVLRSREGRTAFESATVVTGDFVANSTAYGSTAILNRVSGLLQVVLQQEHLPDVDSAIEVFYAAGGGTATVPASALSNSGTFVNGEVTVTLGTGYKLAAAVFYMDGNGFVLSGTTVLYFDFGTSTVVGGYSHTTRKITIPSADGAQITSWVALKESSAAQTISSLTATLPAGLEPNSVTITGTKADNSTFTATANAQGIFNTSLVTGQYTENNGHLSLTFSSPVLPGTVEYSGDLAVYSPTGIDLGGLNPASFPVTGRVPVFKEGNIAVLHRTETIGPQNVSNSQTIDIPENRVARVRVIGANGTVHATFNYGAPPPSGVGCTANLETGSVTFTSVSGYSQPVKIEYRIEDMFAVAGINDDGSVRMNRRVSHAYPAANSKLSSALVAGDLQAHAHDGFTQQTWTETWSDAPIGAAIAAEYNQAAWPIVCENRGTITERWAIIFTSSTQFKVVGETVGVILTGASTAQTCAPVNPMTGGTYFTINPLGWGSGWSAGNVFRFDTESSTWPLWVARTIMPSDPSAITDSLTLGLRGDIDA